MEKFFIHKDYLPYSSLTLTSEYTPCDVLRILGAYLPLEDERDYQYILYYATLIQVMHDRGKHSQ